jgi:hypothetical protein
MADQAWFEMRDIRRRPISGWVWVPLRVSQTIMENGKYGYDGYKEDFFGLGSVAIPATRRADAEHLGWQDIGLGHRQGSYAFEDAYKPADVYQYRDREDLGIELVIEQSFSAVVATEWHLNQDLVFALGLAREGDTWVCPAEAFVEVVRLRRNADGHPEYLEIKAEFLKDYLAARNMMLRVSWYRQRRVTTQDASFLTWPDGRLAEVGDEERFEGRTWAVAEGGELPGASMAVFHMWRTDVDPEVDVPVFGPESAENTGGESRHYIHRGEATLHIIEGEVWRDEWIEPAAASQRVRGDDVNPTAFFLTDAAGTRESRATLRNEDIGKWLWFRPGVVSEILALRDATLAWYSRETGRISMTAGHNVHFGVNSEGLITVYAYDIAKLPDWQQHIWAGFNTAPEGRVSAELLSAQMSARPASTMAVEKRFATALARVNTAFEARWGRPMLVTHPDVAGIMRTVHRFRATDRSGLLALAKDIARLTADSFDVQALHQAAPPTGDGGRGSIKSLERVLATLSDSARARTTMGALAGVYDLRLGDAHLPSSRIEAAFELVGIDTNDRFIHLGEKLLEAASASLDGAADNIEASPPLR